MKIVTSLIFVIAGLFISSCSEPLDQKLLHGTWKADQFIENGKPKDLDISNMEFTFNNEQIYTYQSNLKHREAGKYRLDGDVLYSTDTLIDTKIEKAVRIIQLTSDSLRISMNNGGVKQQIILHKAN